MTRHPISLFFLVAASLTFTACDTLKARSLANDGVALHKKNEYDQAIAKFKEAAALDGNIATIHLNLGFTYLTQFSQSPKSIAGREAGGNAARSFQRYLELKPDDPRGRDYLVQTFVDTNSYTDAVTYFKPEVDHDPPSLEAVTTLGLIASKTGRPGDAIDWYTKRVSLSPQDPEGHLNLGVLLWDHLKTHIDVIGEDRVKLADQGLAAMQKALELRPNAAENYNYVGLLYKERAAGQPDDVKKGADLAEGERYQRMAAEKIAKTNAGKGKK